MECAWVVPFMICYGHTGWTYFSLLTWKEQQKPQLNVALSCGTITRIFNGVRGGDAATGKKNKNKK